MAKKPDRVEVGQRWRVLKSQASTVRDVRGVWAIFDFFQVKTCDLLLYFDSEFLGTDESQTRTTNRAFVNATIADPPHAVLDGRGRKQGPVWDRFCRDVACCLEQCNAKAEPRVMSDYDVSLCVEAALGGG